MPYVGLILIVLTLAVRACPEGTLPALGDYIDTTPRDEHHAKVLAQRDEATLLATDMEALLQHDAFRGHVEHILKCGAPCYARLANKLAAIVHG